MKCEKSYQKKEKTRTFRRFWISNSQILQKPKRMFINIPLDFFLYISSLLVDARHHLHLLQVLVPPLLQDDLDMMQAAHQSSPTVLLPQLQVVHKRLVSLIEPLIISGRKEFLKLHTVSCLQHVVEYVVPPIILVERNGSEIAILWLLHL